MLGKIRNMPLVTMEEHALLGGFGSAVSSWYARKQWTVRMTSFGVEDAFVPHGSRGRLLEYLGLLPEQMAEKIAAFLAGTGKHTCPEEGNKHG